MEVFPDDYVGPVKNNVLKISLHLPGYPLEHQLRNEWKNVDAIQNSNSADPRWNGLVAVRPAVDLGEGWNKGGTKVLPWDISLS